MRAEASNHRTLIRPPSGWSSLDLAELWRYRELILFLMLRDIKIRYKQTFLGIAWAIVQPLVTMLAATVVFGKLVRLDSGQVPYPVFAFIGLVIWTYFSRAMAASTNSLVGNAALLSKIYMPRAALPISGGLSGLLDLGVSGAFLLVLLAFYGYHPMWRSLLAVPFCLLAALTVIGCGLWLSSINVRYRDVGQAVPFFVQTWFFLTPIVYPTNVLGPKWIWLFWLNPMTAVVEGFRWAFTPCPPPPLQSVAVSVAITAVLLISGSFFFRRMESSFADVV